MTDIHCIFHANCHDGLMSAGIVRRKFGPGVVFHEGRYGWRPPEDIVNSQVYIVDFSYPPGDIAALLDRGNIVHCYDHHKTAREALEGVKHINFDFVFDLERSGAGLTWDTLNPGVDRPTVVDRVEDRDLWRFQYQDTRAVHMALSLVSKDDISRWEQLLSYTPEDYAVLVATGQPIEKYYDIQIAAMAERHHWACIGGHWVPISNCPPQFASDVGGALAKTGKGKFGATYYMDGKVAHLSLRARDDFDVSEIAKIYGGGGHKAAAGCIIDPWYETQLRKKAPYEHDADQEAMAV